MKLQKFIRASAFLIATIDTPAAVVNIGALKDNSLYEDAAGSLSNGAGPSFFSGITGAGGIRRGLLEFDLGIIPAGSQIQSVTLVLHLVQAQAFATSMGLHEARTEWGQGTSSAGNRGGGGTQATTGDATWLHSSYTNAFWTNSGGDFEPVSSAATVVGAEGAYYTWASTTALVADVQGWLDAPSSNHGWFLIGDESQNGTAKAFASRENSTPAFQPKLTVSYTPIPEPSAAFIGLLGAASTIAARRRRRSSR